MATIAQEISKPTTVTTFHPGQLGLVLPKIGTLIPNRIFVGGINSDTSEGELYAFFSKFGNIKDVKIINDKSGLPKGSYGFVTFENRETAEAIINNESESLILKDRKLNIGYAVRKQHVFTKQEFGNTVLLAQNVCSFLNGIPVYPLCPHECSIVTMAQPTICCPTAILLPPCGLNQYNSGSDKRIATCSSEVVDVKPVTQAGDHEPNTNSELSTSTNIRSLAEKSAVSTNIKFTQSVNNPKHIGLRYSECSTSKFPLLMNKMIHTKTPFTSTQLGPCSQLSGIPITMNPAMVNYISQNRHINGSTDTSEIIKEISVKDNSHSEHVTNPEKGYYYYYASTEIPNEFASDMKHNDKGHFPSYASHPEVQHHNPTVGYLNRTKLLQGFNSSGNYNFQLTSDGVPVKNVFVMQKNLKQTQVPQSPQNSVSSKNLSAVNVPDLLHNSISHTTDVVDHGTGPIINSTDFPDLSTTQSRCLKEPNIEEQLYRYCNVVSDQNGGNPLDETSNNSCAYNSNKTTTNWETFYRGFLYQNKRDLLDTETAHFGSRKSSALNDVWASPDYLTNCNDGNYSSSATRSNRALSQSNGLVDCNEIDKGTDFLEYDRLTEANAHSWMNHLQSQLKLSYSPKCSSEDRLKTSNHLNSLLEPSMLPEITSGQQSDKTIPLEYMTNSNFPEIQIKSNNHESSWPDASDEITHKKFLEELMDGRCSNFRKEQSYLDHCLSFYYSE